MPKQIVAYLASWWRRRWRSLFVEVAIFVGIFVALRWWQNRNLLPTGEEAPAPHFSLVEVETGEVIESGKFNGKRTLIYFFAPWCGVCSASIGNLENAFRSIDHQRFALVAVALSYSNAAEIADYKRQHQLTMPVLLGSDEIGERYHVSAFPTYYVLDEQGKLIARDSGYSTALGLAWRFR